MPLRYAGSRSKARRRAAGLVAPGRAEGAVQVGFLSSSRSGRVGRAVRSLNRGRSSETDMVAALDAVGRAARSGAGIRAALEQAQPVAGVHSADLAALLSSVERGASIRSALESWRRRAASDDVALTSAAVALGVSSGASLARAADNAAATLRERVALRSEVRVNAAQARSGASVVGVAPMAFTVLAVSAEPAIAEFLFSTAAGWACLAVGISLTLAGFAWMQLLVVRAGGW